MSDNDSAFVLSLNQERRLEIPDKKQQHLDPLLRSLDAIIYIHFAVIYACDNLSLLLILRLVNQIVHIQPHPSQLPQLPATILVNVGCFVIHLLSDSTSGKRLYGGLLIDFVGEVAPSLARLLWLDIVILALQLVMLVVGYEKYIASGGAQTSEETPAQDLESEEAGQLRSRAQDGPSESEEGIEMQSLLPDGQEESTSAHAKRDDPGGQDDDLILLDMKKGLRALFRRPPLVFPPPPENAATRASLATFLGRLAAARGAGT